MAHLLEALWTRLGGPADQGPVDLAKLTRRSVPNDSVAASPGATAARVDVALPVFAIPPQALLARLDAALAEDGDVVRVDHGQTPNYRRYVARSAVLRFPDTIDVDAFGAPEGTLMRIYARALLGRSDLGANTRRLSRWAELLANAAR
ncbi:MULTISPECIES: DUF1499 domain-containing protein [Aurantimonas]|jgi:uncharacterized protein (DUF1499 family)|uniref:DUF1499 domain-containing protein n=1 Tax=Aurantimonas TaxID=182269 RepID=UPI0004012C6E|nr:DUF1499 domain-containing protein [Aurantimonas coralicida]